MFKRCLVCLSLCTALMLPMMARADIGKEQAAAIAQDRFQGRVIAVSEEPYQNQRAYRVKILSDKGELHLVIIDLQSGDILAAH